MEKWYMPAMPLLVIIGVVLIAGCTTTIPVHETGGQEETDTKPVYIVGILKH